MLWATDPLPLPEGWGSVGPIASGWRGAAAFDVRDCALHVLQVDLDGGPYFHDVRVARLWQGTGWEWADAWTVVDGRLLRPGRASVSVGSWPGRLEVDSKGRVTARVVDGRRVEVVYGEAGQFAGMRSGTVAVLLTAEGVEASDGRRAGYTLSGTRVDAVAAPAGTTVYTYENEALRTVQWADGGALRLEADGSSGLGGRWRCSANGQNVRIESSDGRWTVERDPEELVVTSPQGGGMRTRWKAGLLMGWTDSEGTRVDVERDPTGRVDGVRRGGEQLAALSWGETGLAELRSDAGAWRLVRAPDGTVLQRTEPDGRGPIREGVAGRLKGLRQGAESYVVTWDTQGRPSRVQRGAQGETRIERDAAGWIRRVTDGAGGVWAVERDPAGAPIVLVDPAGRRWNVRTDAGGRLSRVAGPDGIDVSIVRSEGRLSQVMEGARRWSWLRDAAGRLAGVRDPEGRLTALSRDPGGAVVSVRTPDGATLALGRGPLGRLRSIDQWRIARDSLGKVTEIRGIGGALAGWSRTRGGFVTGFGMGDVSFEFTRDAAGRIAAVRAGETDAERWRLNRDSAGRVAEVVPATGGRLSLARDSAGLVTRITDPFGTVTLRRDMRGRVDRVVADRTWTVGRDLVGRVVQVEVDGLGTVGADYEASGALRLLRLPDGSLIRRNESADAGELLATDQHGAAVGSAGWTRDDSGRLLTVQSGGEVRLDRDAAGRLAQSLGPEGEWSREAGRLRMPDGSALRTTAEGRPIALTLMRGGPWALAAGEATYRWEGDRLTGLDGGAGGASLLHDALGRPTQLTLGDRTIRIERDALGRLRRVGDDVITAWDALLSIGRAPRVPWANGVVARPGGAVLSDPRGHPLLVPWSPPLRRWPTGWVPTVAAAETGAGGRYVLPGGVLLGFLRALDPLSGIATTPDRWPWVPLDPEVAPDLALFQPPDGATSALWDPTVFDAVRGWSDPLWQMVEGGWLPGGAVEPAEAPGLPWLPASFARSVPAPVAGYGGLLLDEDVAGQLLLQAAMEGVPVDNDAVLDAFVGSELRAEALDVPGFDLPAPGFLGATLAERPFGH